MGIALATGICYAPRVVLINLPLGLCLWIVLVFIEAFPIVRGADCRCDPDRAVVAGDLEDSSRAIAEVLARHRLMIASLGLFLVWLTSAIWARDASQVFDQITYQYATGITFVIVATTPRTRSTYGSAVAAFVLSAVCSHSASSSTGSAPAAAPLPWRPRATAASGGRGDPNFLGAGLVPAIVLAALMRQVTPWRAGCSPWRCWCSRSAMVRSRAA